MICALIGDRTIGNLAEGHLEDRLRVLIEERHVSAFVMGYFGPFERLALRVIRRLQQDYPLLKLYGDPVRAAKRDAGRSGA